MATINFVKDKYVRKYRFKVDIEYEGAKPTASTFIIVYNPDGTKFSTTRRLRYSSGKISFIMGISNMLGIYKATLETDSKEVAHDTMDLVEKIEEPSPPPPSGFFDTGELTPAKIEVAQDVYDVKFTLTGYKDKIITNVVVTEGTTKSVSATLEPEVAPPVTKTVIFRSVPDGASVNVVHI